MDWPKFCSQLVKNIDQKELAATNKLSYLYCYLSPKVRAVINGLPYNEAGYKRPKEILERKYGIEEEIVAAFEKEITDLPRIATANTRKVEKF